MKYSIGFTTIGLMSLFLLFSNTYASCHASVHFYLENKCPWPVTFTKSVNGGGTDTYTLNINEKKDAGKYTEKTLTFSDTYGDRSTIWLHSHYQFHWGFGNQCNYYYSPRNQASKGYDVSEHKWSGSTPNLTLTACAKGAEATITTVGLGTTSITKDGTLQPQGHTLNIPPDNKGTYTIGFSNSNTSCLFKPGQSLYCSQPDVGYAFNEGKLIFICQQVDPRQGQCQWVANKKNNTYGVINFFSGG